MKKVLSLILALCMILPLAACTSKAKEQDYDAAMRYMKQCKYEEAITAFNALGDYMNAEDCAKYCEAQTYCYAGDYQTAYDILTQISNMQEADALLKEIFFETRLFEGLSDMRQHFKNPNSISVNSVTFTYNTTNTDAVWKKENPACVITVSAQNGFGGYSLTYVLLTQDKGSTRYTYYGSCTSLDYDELDDFGEKLIAAIINTQLDNPEVPNPINIERVNEVIGLQKYSNITRISSQNYTDINY